MPAEFVEHAIERMSSTVADPPQVAAEGAHAGPRTGAASGPLGLAQAADRENARLHAVRARILAEFAASRAASTDRAQGGPGAMSPERRESRPEVLREVSEWATPEASMASTRSQPKAEAMVAEALTLQRKLPGTLAALEADEPDRVLHRPHFGKDQHRAGGTTWPPTARSR